MALFAGMLYVYRRSEHPTHLSRALEAGVSGMIAYSVSQDAAAWAGVNDAVAALVLTSVGYLLLDVARSIVADRAMLKKIIINRLGGRGDDGSS